MKPEIKPPNSPLRGRNHVLFKNKVPKIKIDNPLIREYTLYLSTFMENKVDLAEIMQSFNELTPNDNIKLIINSLGGFVYEGKALINIIQRTGSFVETEIPSDAASMASILFCIGDKRVIYESSSIMFHTFSGGTSGKGQEMKDQTKHQNKIIPAFFKSYIVGLTKTEIDEMLIGKDWWFGSQEMCRRQIATHVNIGGVLITAKKYLTLLKKVKKIGKKQGLKISSLQEGLLYGIDALTPLVEEDQKELETIYKKLDSLVTEHPSLES